MASHLLNQYIHFDLLSLVFPLFYLKFYDLLANINYHFVFFVSFKNEHWCTSNQNIFFKGGLFLYFLIDLQKQEKLNSVHWLHYRLFFFAPFEVNNFE